MKKICVIVFLLLVAACTNEPRKVRIRNAQGESIYLQVDGLAFLGGKKLAVIQHGLASDMTHPVVREAKKAFLDRGYVVVTFDSRYSLGKSGGNVSKARLATFEDDLQTVADWAKKQGFYREPFALAGHSLGGASVLVYAARNPAQVERLIVVAPVISGQKWEETCMANMHDFCEEWKKNGFYDYQNEKISYQVIEEAKAYDAVRLAEKITAEVLLVAAEDDNVVAEADVRELYEALPAKKSLAVIPGSGHNFRSAADQENLYHSVAGFLR